MGSHLLHNSDQPRCCGRLASEPPSIELPAAFPYPASLYRVGPILTHALRLPYAREYAPIREDLRSRGHAPRPSTRIPAAAFSGVALRRRLACPWDTPPRHKPPYGMPPHRKPNAASPSLPPPTRRALRSLLPYIYIGFPEAIGTHGIQSIRQPSSQAKPPGCMLARCTRAAGSATAPISGIASGLPCPPPSRSG